MNQKHNGFSLVELMIVTAIIGILAAIALPNFTEFARRARHTEAKTNLAALYSAEVSFVSEWGEYTSTLDSVGFEPIGPLYYNLGFVNVLLPPAGALPGTAACIQVCPASLCPTYTGHTCLPSAGFSLDGTYLATITTSTFRAVAHSHFTSVPTDWYSFTIDDQKVLRQIVPAN